MRDRGWWMQVLERRGGGVFKGEDATWAKAQQPRVLERPETRPGQAAPPAVYTRPCGYSQNASDWSAPLVGLTPKSPGDGAVSASGSWQEGAVSALTFVRCIFNIIALVDGSSVSFSAAGNFHLISSLPSVPKKEAGRICRRDRSAVRGRKRNQHSVTEEKISGKPAREDLGAFVRC